MHLRQSNAQCVSRNGCFLARARLAAPINPQNRRNTDTHSAFSLKIDQFFIIRGDVFWQVPPKESPCSNVQSGYESACLSESQTPHRLNQNLLRHYEFDNHLSTVYVDEVIELMKRPALEHFCPDG